MYSCNSFARLIKVYWVTDVANKNPDPQTRACNKWSLPYFSVIQLYLLQAPFRWGGRSLVSDNLPPSAFAQACLTSQAGGVTYVAQSGEAKEPSALRYPGSSTCLVAADMCLISVYMGPSGSGAGRGLCILPLFLASIFLYVWSQY